MSGSKRLPSDKVVVRNGRIVRIEQWCFCCGDPVNIILIIKNREGKFVCLVTNPESREIVTIFGNTPEEALVKLHHDIRKKYAGVLNMENPSEEELKRLFGAHDIIFEG